MRESYWIQARFALLDSEFQHMQKSFAPLMLAQKSAIGIRREFHAPMRRKPGIPGISFLSMHRKISWRLATRLD